jgi:endogenous inhibitor of DNA gyrase (YacG/DUF329 family)
VALAGPDGFCPSIGDRDFMRRGGSRHRPTAAPLCRLIDLCCWALTRSFFEQAAKQEPVHRGALFADFVHHDDHGPAFMVEEGSTPHSVLAQIAVASVQQRAPDFFPP